MTNQNELKIVRILNAAKDQVWHAWSDVEHFKKWWGTRSERLFLGSSWTRFLPTSRRAPKKNLGIISATARLGYLKF